MSQMELVNAQEAGDNFFERPVWVCHCNAWDAKPFECNCSVNIVEKKRWIDWWTKDSMSIDPVWIEAINKLLSENKQLRLELSRLDPASGLVCSAASWKSFEEKE